MASTPKVHPFERRDRNEGRQPDTKTRAETEGSCPPTVPGWAGKSMARKRGRLFWVQGGRLNPDPLPLGPVCHRLVGYEMTCCGPLAESDAEVQHVVAAQALSCRVVPLERLPGERPVFVGNLVREA